MGRKWQRRPATSLGRDTKWVRQLQLSGYTNSGAVLPDAAGCIPLGLALDRYAVECASLHHACHLHQATSGAGITVQRICGKWHNKQTLTFRHRASCILGQAFRYSPENAFYIFNEQIYFII